MAIFSRASVAASRMSAAADRCMTLLIVGGSHNFPTSPDRNRMSPRTGYDPASNRPLSCSNASLPKAGLSAASASIATMAPRRTDQLAWHTSSSKAGKTAVRFHRHFRYPSRRTLPQLHFQRHRPHIGRVVRGQQRDDFLEAERARPPKPAIEDRRRHGVDGVAIGQLRKEGAIDDAQPDQRGGGGQGGEPAHRVRAVPALDPDMQIYGGRKVHGGDASENLRRGSAGIRPIGCLDFRGSSRYDAHRMCR